jgi:hypothetical protein
MSVSIEAFQALQQKVESLSNELGIVQDIQAVRTLQFKYGYYMDKGLYDEVVDLFAEQGELQFMGGIFRGRAGLRRLYCERLRAHFTGGHNGPVYGLLADHMQLQDIVDVAPDRKRAHGRFRCFMQGGSHVMKPTISSRLPLQWWEAGVYENTYVKQSGSWRIQTLDYHMFWQADFEKGWAHSVPYQGRFFEKTFPDDPAGPDELTDRKACFWPETPVVPFHYPHPTTGAVWDATRQDGRRSTIENG